eukprot:5937066-Pyramimonas_sp.AAC.1
MASKEEVEGRRQEGRERGVSMRPAPPLPHPTAQREGAEDHHAGQEHHERGEARRAGRDGGG